MNKLERSKLEAIKLSIESSITEAEAVQKALEKKIKNLNNKFPDSPQKEKLEDEVFDLDNAIGEMYLACSFMRQALEGRS